MPKRIILIPTPSVPAQNSGHVLDVFLILLLWYGVRYAVHHITLAVLPSELISLRLQLAYSARSLAGLLFCIWYFKRVCHRRNVGFSERFGLDRPMDLTDPTLSRSLVLFLLTFGLPNLAYYVFAIRSYGYGGHGMDITSYFLTGLRVILLSPVAEELIWRGFAYPIFKERYGLWKGILITSFLFALPHLNMIWTYPFPMVPIVFIYFFLVAVGLAIIFEQRANLKWCMLAHALLNLTLFAADIISRKLITL